MANSATTKKAKAEIATIDCALVTITVGEGDQAREFGFDTSNSIQVEPQLEEEEAVRLVVKGILRAQKPRTTTITGNQITLTDNVFNPELVQILQGGTVEWDQATGKLKRYIPPVAGSSDKGQVFKLNAYSAHYDAAGLIVDYEKITYPNCKGQPVAFSSEDNTFRAPEYVIDSAPKQGEAPYIIEYVDKLPDLEDENPIVEPATGTVLGKDMSALGDYTIGSDGIVDGSFNVINGWTEFSADEDLQDGYYFAFNYKNWQGNSVQVMSYDGQREKKQFSGDGICVVFLGADADAARTITAINILASNNEVLTTMRLGDVTFN